ncbi:type II secretion system F family protein [Periweissella ghanensis]|uniref:Type II secretion system protein GspF domain-containing protein n=1 Tax=Periweissella ghanensis TaxID=467997 RepID=A0ABM8ZAZ3_9LACO|nr:type II secretion system F family protein [Periweissella ghanensis]MCM0600633.1 type II secretion system F family protein [Periweissella ghanensis]CAH0418477.1 hypothetical protein WGH24286_00895 [Periweissella ghanensis]
MKNLKRLALKDQVSFFELITALLHAGFQLQTALSFMAQLEDTKFKAPVLAMQHTMQNGQSFANSIKPFVEAEISWQIELAEAHGSLPMTITVIARNLQQRFTQQRKLRQLMQYPVVLIALLIAMGLFLRFYFIEQLLRLNQTAMQILPSGNLPGLKLAFIGLIIGSISLYWWYQHLTTPQKIIFLLKIPVVKQLVKEQLNYQVSFTFALLLQAGHSYQEMSQLFVKLPEKSILHHIGHEIQQHSNAGANLATFIGKLPYISHEFALFFVRGKTNVEVGKDLLAYSKISFETLVKRYERLLAAIQPVMFIGIAIGIVSMYAAMLLPMYQMIGELK